MVTPAQKGDMLERVEALRRAVKQALSRANAAYASEPAPTVGVTLLSYVFFGTVPATRA